MYLPFESSLLANGSSTRVELFLLGQSGAKVRFLFEDTLEAALHLNHRIWVI